MSKTFHNYPVEQSMKLAVDAVVFGYTKETGLSVLLIKERLPHSHINGLFPEVLYIIMRVWRMEW